MSDSLSALIRRARQDQGISQAQLAQLADVGMATVQNIERSVANPSFATIKAIATVLGIHIRFDYKKKAINWNIMACLGCPLLVDQPASVIPTRGLLIEHLKALDITKIDGRKAKAVAAWLHAIRDHYPSVWKDINYTIRAWGQNQQPSAKHRRLSLQILGGYL